MFLIIDVEVLEKECFPLTCSNQISPYRKKSLNNSTKQSNKNSFSFLKLLETPEDDFDIDSSFLYQSGTTEDSTVKPSRKYTELAPMQQPYNTHTVVNNSHTPSFLDYPRYVDSVASDDKVSFLENRITTLENVVQNLQNQVLQLINNNRRGQDDHEEVVNQVSNE